MTLGGSDIQYKEMSNKPPNKRRLENYFSECKLLYEYLMSDDGSDYTELISTPFVTALVDELDCYIQKEKFLQDEEVTLLLLYTHQNPEDSMDTFWAYKIIKYLAEETNFYNRKIKVFGIRVNGNPSNHQEMIYLYYDVCTTQRLIEYGVADDDTLIACFTAGTPAMSQYLMLGFSGLKFPEQRYCYQLNIKSGRLNKIPVAELLRHETIFHLVKERLNSKRFEDAIVLLKEASFDFLRPHLPDIKLGITMLHKRFLFDYKGAIEDYNRISKYSPLKELFSEEKKHLQSCKEAMKGLEEFRHRNLIDEKKLSPLIRDYFYKLQFFYENNLWNEFTILASSFYEWLLQTSFYYTLNKDIILNKKKSDGSNWIDFLVNYADKNPKATLLEGKNLRIISSNFKNKPNKTLSSRYFYIEFLRQFEWGKKLTDGEWSKMMDTLYLKIRNDITHNLTGIDEEKRKEIIRILNGDEKITSRWVNNTKIFLDQIFNIEFSEKYRIDCSVENLNKYLQLLFEQTYMKGGASC